MDWFLDKFQQPGSVRRLAACACHRSCAGTAWCSYATLLARHPPSFPPPPPPSARQAGGGTSARMLLDAAVRGDVALAQAALAGGADPWAGVPPPVALAALMGHRRVVAVMQAAPVSRHAAVVAHAPNSLLQLAPWAVGRSSPRLRAPAAPSPPPTAPHLSPERISAALTFRGIPGHLHADPAILALYCNWTGPPRADVVMALLAAGRDVNAAGLLAPAPPAVLAATRDDMGVALLDAILVHGARLDGVATRRDKGLWEHAADAVERASRWMAGTPAHEPQSVLEAAVQGGHARKIACVLRHARLRGSSLPLPRNWYRCADPAAIQELLAAYPAAPRQRATIHDPASRPSMPTAPAGPTVVGEGRTGLYSACIASRPDAVEAWLDAGADALHEDASGFRPRDVVGGCALLARGHRTAGDAYACVCVLVRAEAWARRRWAVVRIAL
jgi:hypothetical protein